MLFIESSTIYFYDLAGLSISMTVERYNTNFRLGEQCSVKIMICVMLEDPLNLNILQILNILLNSFCQ